MEKDNLIVLCITFPAHYFDQNKLNNYSKHSKKLVLSLYKINMHSLMWHKETLQLKLNFLISTRMLFFIGLFLYNY